MHAYAALNASQVTISYVTLGNRVHWIIWYFVAVVGVFALVYGYNVCSDRLVARGYRLSGSSVPAIALPLVRLVSYSHIKCPSLKWMGPPLNGMLIFLPLILILLVALTFGKRPYYGEHYGLVRHVT
ncbi:hypothetical protein BKA65DRAFT_22568 [Rhexocercosporidium sp. MPI-PUGE-AT-0058]|nr:hypothetical protein BKA65DRAFT_22568 [Rhexocercosporidium sp. MPI-PUGE-AT-0058]